MGGAAAPTNPSAPETFLDFGFLFFCCTPDLTKISARRGVQEGSKGVNKGLYKEDALEVVQKMISLQGNEDRAIRFPLKYSSTKLHLMASRAPFFANQILIIKF